MRLLTVSRLVFILQEDYKIIQIEGVNNLMTIRQSIATAQSALLSKAG